MASFKTFSLTEKIPEPALKLDQCSDSDLSDNDAIIHSDEDESGDFDSGLDSDENMQEENAKATSGWADAMAKILKSNKPKRKKSIVLAKAKKLNDVLKKEKIPNHGFEIEGEEEDEKPQLEDIDVKPKLEQKPNIHRLKKLGWYSKGRQKPNVLEKDRERTLAKIGTKGVVQLFNAVKQQQKMIDTNLEKLGSGPAKRDKILKTLDKKSFLDVIMGSVKSQPVDNPVKEDTEVKTEDRSSAPSWDVLREDFMMGGRFKDWDRSEPANEPDVKPMEEESDSDSD